MNYLPSTINLVNLIQVRTLDVVYRGGAGDTRCHLTTSPGELLSWYWTEEIWCIYWSLSCKLWTLNPYFVDLLGTYWREWVLPQNTKSISSIVTCSLIRSVFECQTLIVGKRFVLVLIYLLFLHASLVPISSSRHLRKFHDIYHIQYSPRSLSTLCICVSDHQE